MTPKFSVIVAVAGLALLVAAPAVGKVQPVEEQWQKALQARGTALNEQHGLGGTTQGTTQTSTYEQALQARSEGLNRIYELGSTTPTRVVTSERATQEQGTTSYEQALVLRGQELNRHHELGSFAPQYMDAGERAIRVQPEPRPAIVPDALERAVANQGTDGFVKGDDFVRMDPSDLPTVVSVPTASPTGTEVEWPQIGIGFGIGLLLMLGIALTWRLTRIHPFAH